MFNNLSQYLKKLTAVVPHEKIIKETCIEVFSRVMNYTLTKDMIRVQHACIWIRVPSVVRAEIERHKTELIHAINAQNNTQEKVIQKIQYM